MTKSYKALESKKTDQGNQLDLVEKNIDDLPEGDLLIKVQYSSLNYKDAMSAKGIPGVTRNYPILLVLTLLVLLSLPKTITLKKAMK